MIVDTLQDILERNGVDFDDGDWTQSGDTLIELREEAIKLIKEQMEVQGCVGDSFESIKLMQSNLFAWIEFFNLTKEELEG